MADSDRKPEEDAQLAPLDPQIVQTTLENPPFVQLDGVINSRDLGRLPSTAHPKAFTKPLFMFRSAELSGISDKGKSQLRDLGIKKVFDLRSDDEMKKYDTPLPEIQGVDVIRCPVFRKDDYSPEVMAERYQLYASGKTEAFMQLYSQILEAGGSAFGTILRHVRDQPSEGFIFNCTAGKDRTGIVAAILLKLAGVDDDLIAHDYALTRIGREPARAKILARLSKEPLFASNNQAALNMLTCRTETMTAFLQLLQDQYGGAEKYCERYLGLSSADIDIIKEHMLVQSSSEAS